MNLNCHKWMLVDKVITGEPVYLFMVSGNFNFIQNHLAVKQFSYISPNYISLSCQENNKSEMHSQCCSQSRKSIYLFVSTVGISLEKMYPISGENWKFIQISFSFFRIPLIKIFLIA